MYNRKEVKTLKITSLRIKNFCGVEHYYAEYEDIVFVDKCHADAVYRAVVLLLDIFDVDLRDMAYPEAELTAMVELSGCEYTLQHRYGRNYAYKDGKECTADFYKKIHRSITEQTVTRFAADGYTDYSKTLEKYADMLKYDLIEPFATLTDDIGTTTMFRRKLRQTIENFKPQTFVGKTVVLDKKGRFMVQTNTLLSAADILLFNCYCFFRVAEFWDDVALEKNMHREKFPLLVCGLFSRIDPTKPKNEVIAEAKKSGHQVFFID